MSRHAVSVNRAPVLTLWAAVVAERLGFRRAEALTFGRAVAGLNACSKGKALGICRPGRKSLTEKRKALRDGATVTVDLLNRAVPAVRTPDGLRALSKGKPIDSAGVERYLEGKFGDALDDVRAAMHELARSYPPSELARRAFGLYETFRPEVPAGTAGWGAKGRLSIDGIRGLAQH